jgi:RNA polymerase sigma factor (sigma-70 family)
MRPALGGATPAQAGTESDAAQPTPAGRRNAADAAFALASDKRLARRAAAGDPEAFAAIFRRYHQDLYRFCVGILREPQDAEDAVQNTMIRAMRALPGERREMQLKPWLYRIAHNEAVELRRRERPVEQLTPTIDDGAVTEEVAERDAKLQALLADIADLPERQRAALVMREVNGLGFGEIGDALGTSPGAVRQALYEARRGLSQMELGRDMDCESAMRQVSDAEGLPRRRGVRAHLRGCARCRRFQAEIRGREGSLAAISPLPGLALVALMKGALGGSAAGGAVAGGALVGAGVSGAGAIPAGGGVAGSALAGAGSPGAGAATGALVGAGASGAGGGAGFLAGAGASGAVKAGVGLLAAIAVGTATVDHGALLRNAGPVAPGVEHGGALVHGDRASGSGGAARTLGAGRVHHARRVPADHAHGDRAALHDASLRRPGAGAAVEASAVGPSAVAVGEPSDPSSLGTSEIAAAGGPVGSTPVEQPTTGAPGPQAAVGVPAAPAEQVVASGGEGGSGQVGTGGDGGPAPEASALADEEAPGPQASPEPMAHAEPAAEAPAAEAPAPAAEAPDAETGEPLPEAATPAAAAAPADNGKGLAKGHARQAEEGE